MAAKETEKSKPLVNEKKGDPGTLNTTDPQEHMEGPISSFMHKAGEAFPDKITQEEADRKARNQ